MPKLKKSAKSKKKLAVKKTAGKKLKTKSLASKKVKAKSKVKSKVKSKAKSKAKSKKSKKVMAIPKGYVSVTPYLIVDNATNAIDFYKKVFGAKEIMRFASPDGKIGHAELKIGDSIIMLSDESPEMNTHSPQTYNGSPVSIYLYIKDVDAIAQRAVEHGATLERPIEDKFYGDRTGTVVDPYGHIWHVSTHVEDVSKGEMKKRIAKLYGSMSM